MKHKTALFIRATLVIAFSQASLAAEPGIDCKAIARTSPASVAKQPAEIAGARAFVYRDVNGTLLRLHVFIPPYHRDSDKTPAVVFFMGGGWAFGTVWQFVPQARYLAQRGTVAIVADYRVKCRDDSAIEDSMADARTAVRWIRSHASTLGVDPNRLAAAGGSAGGFLAASAALFDDASEARQVSSMPSALILFNPWLGEVTAIAKPNLPSDPERVHAISPMNHIRDDMPPTLILQGRADTATPYIAAARFCEAVEALGAQCEVVGYEGAEHGFFNAPDAGLPENPDNPEKKTPSDHYRQTVFEVDRFLGALGYFD